MTLKEIMTELKSYENDGIKKILLKHGVKEPFFGVKVEHLIAHSCSKQHTFFQKS